MFADGEPAGAAAVGLIGVRICSDADRMGWSGAVLEIDQFDLDEIVFALSDQNVYDEHLHLINPETGEIVLWTREGGIDGPSQQ